MEQHTRIIFAAILSVIIITTWQYFIIPQTSEGTHNIEVVEDSEKINLFETNDNTIIKQGKTIADGYNDHTRVNFENDYISGSINLIGAQLDNLILKKYQLDDQSDNVTLLSPEFIGQTNLVKIDWKTSSKNPSAIELPNSETKWHAIKHTQNNIIIEWINKENIRFIIDITLDDKYMFNIKTIVDTSHAIYALTNEMLRGHISMQRMRKAEISDSMMLHEGAIGVIDSKLKEINFTDIQSEQYKTTKNQQIDWMGFSDKYWLVSVIPTSSNAIGSFFSHFSEQWNDDKFQMDLYLNKHNLDEKIIQDSFMLFAGAKSIDILDSYGQKLNIKMFDRAVDLGFLYFITKPIFIVLNYFYELIGNFGLAIMLLTVLTKILLFPLAYKSVKSMNNIKKIQPQVTKLKEQYSDNMLFQQKLLALYKKENVNPASGCLPIILQMPIFFALYKVLYVTLEMRHAPFFLWIHDLSAPDSTTIFNLFGLIQWQPPLFLMIGVLPLLMSLTMFLQQLMNPQPTDPTQAAMMKLMPLFLLFMFARFPSGLLLYWTWSNILSIGQQFIIKYLPE